MRARMAKELFMIERLLAARHTAPDWTDANSHDPGMTQLQLLAYAADDLLYRRHATPGQVNGLAVQTETEQPAAVNVSPGFALSREGHPIGLAAMASRYIGETEKGLASRFGEAAASDAALCYGADALFDPQP